VTCSPSWLHAITSHLDFRQLAVSTPDGSPPK
jgi:hypothetical protein